MKKLLLIVLTLVSAPLFANGKTAKPKKGKTTTSDSVVLQEQMKQLEGAFQENEQLDSDAAEKVIGSQEDVRLYLALKLGLRATVRQLREEGADETKVQLQKNIKAGVNASANAQANTVAPHAQWERAPVEPERKRSAASHSQTKPVVSAAAQEADSKSSVSHASTNTNPQHACSACQKPAARLVCSGCKASFYCDATCQKRHWKEHKASCDVMGSIVRSFQKAMGGEGSGNGSLEALLNSCDVTISFNGDKPVVSSAGNVAASTPSANVQAPVSYVPTAQNLKVPEQERKVASVVGAYGLSSPAATGWEDALPLYYVPKSDKRNFTPEVIAVLNHACETKNFAGLEKMIKENPAIVDMVDSSRQNNLLIILMSCCHGVPDDLLAQVIGMTRDIRCRNTDGQTALAYAAYYGRAKCVKMLMDRGATISVFDGQGNTPLMEAMVRQDPATIQCLLSRGANINDRNHGEETALVWAVDEGVQRLGTECSVCKERYRPSQDHRAATLQYLISQGALFGRLSNKGDTELARAVSYRNIPAVRVLIANRTPLDSAVSRSKGCDVPCPNPILSVLQSRSARINSVNKQPSQDDVRAMESDLQIFKMLLMAGAHKEPHVMDSVVSCADGQAATEFARRFDVFAHPDRAKHVRDILVTWAAADPRTQQQHSPVPIAPAAKQGLRRIYTLLTERVLSQQLQNDYNTQCAVADAMMYHRVFEGNATAPSILLEFIGGPAGKLEKAPAQAMTTEQAVAINNIKWILRYENDAALKDYLQENPESLDLVDEAGNTPLLLAILYGKQSASKLIQDKLRELGKDRLKAALVHTNRQGYNAMALASAIAK